MAEDWRSWMAQNSMAPGLTASNVEDPETMSGVPVRQAGGAIVPAPDTSGLYAIYGRRNPYSAAAKRYGGMAGMDTGGRLGQLPGIAQLSQGRGKYVDVDDSPAQLVDFDQIANLERPNKGDVKVAQYAHQQFFADEQHCARNGSKGKCEAGNR